MESTPMRNGTEVEGVPLSRDSDFFEEKQLVTLRAQHQTVDYAQHVNLQRLMPRTDILWVTAHPRNVRIQSCKKINMKDQILVVFTFLKVVSSWSGLFWE
ncbi:hypothetical protein NDU88_008371 [Pleurodeles waltl]|uniref:Uncharacterized protein n=1 Tax=Pleurodeles waltl TaxID=8319 RepID=A0AAV7NZ56_PLEWA|nr:hypothetical protein NDU88_008371 [Pleurodeles waltl]